MWRYLASCVLYLYQYYQPNISQDSRPPLQTASSPVKPGPGVWAGRLGEMKYFLNLKNISLFLKDFLCLASD